MIAYKGFNENLMSVMGNRDKKSCSFHPGETKEVEGSKTVREGFHCCEYPFGCLCYYPMDGKNRFFRVEAEGDIDEDESRIACTKITLKKELTPYDMAMEAMKYMIVHQSRTGWETHALNVTVQKDKAKAKNGQIAIARGENPRVRGEEGSILGLLMDNGEMITGAALFIANGQQSGKWYELDIAKGTNQIRECKDERESD
ncbi:MAG: hypothetical protein MR713_01930 [Firmicutes bacterium]|nr:hypothetical protein [Bacillota bacterium]